MPPPDDSVALWRRLLDLLPDATLIVNGDGTIGSANAAASALLSPEGAPLVGRAIRALVTSSPEALERHLSAAWRSGSALPGAATFLVGATESRLRLSSAVLTPLRSEAPALLVRVHAPLPSPFQRLTDLVNALTAENVKRRDDQTRLQSTVDGAPVAICVRDDAGRLVLTNTTFNRWFGQVRSETRGSLPPDALPAESRALVEAVEQMATSAAPVEQMIGSGDAARHTVVASFDAGRSGAAQLRGAVWVDVTSQKRAEEERETMYASVLHAQKLESLGVLAGGIAHDFNNLLAAILGNAELATSEVEVTGEAAACLRDITTAAQRAAELCKQMLAYAGKGQFDLRSIDVNDVVGEMNHLLHASTSKAATVRLNLAPRVAPIEADVSQFRQVVMNLITNASDAIEQAPGTITIATGTTAYSAERLATMNVGAGLTSGLYTWFEVSDTGGGMAAETRAKMFDPFFSTKFPGRGLGLAAVLGIVNGHRGALRVSSELGRGTTFRVLFPPSTVVATEWADETPMPLPWSGKGTVLVVDDEPAVSAVARRILVKTGFDVLLTGDGEEALRVLSKRKDVCLVLLDLAMPRMGGEETFRQMRLLRPDLRVILCTGYDEQASRDRFAGKGLAGFVQKPYHLIQFIETVRLVMER